MDICVDFDGTCVTHDFPKVGKNIGAQKVLMKLVDNGHRLILFTMRDKEHLMDAIKWFEDNKIPLYGIQENPTQKQWTGSPKAYGAMYIDDAALGMPLLFDGDLSSRFYVDWYKVEQLLKERGLINE